MKKVFVRLVLILSLSILVSCGEEEESNTVTDRTYDEGEVVAAAKTLIQKTEDLNEILWGSGIRYTLDEAPNGYYYRADGFFLIENEIRDYDHLKELTRDAFTDSYATQIFNSSVFSEAKDIYGNIAHLARYGRGDEGEILVYSKWEPFNIDIPEYKYDTLKCVSVKGDEVFVSIECSVIDEQTGDEISETLTVGLIEEADGWRINTPTYFTYVKEEK